MQGLGCRSAARRRAPPAFGSRPSCLHCSKRDCRKTARTASASSVTVLTPLCTAAIDSSVGRQQTEGVLSGPKSAASKFVVLACTSSQQESLNRNKICTLCYVQTTKKNKFSPWPGPVFYSRKIVGSNFIGLRAVLCRRNLNNTSEKHAQLTLYYVQEEGPRCLVYCC